MMVPQQQTHPPLPYVAARAQHRCQRCLGESGVTPQLVGLRHAGRTAAWKRAVLCDPCLGTAGDAVAVLRLASR